MLKPIFGRDFEKDFKIKLKIIAKNIGSKFSFIRGDAPRNLVKIRLKIRLKIAGKTSVVI